MKFGLVGTGYWARAVHGRAIVDDPSHELAGVWGGDAGRAAAAADELGTRAFRSAAELFEAVDAVAFAVPPDVQAELAVQAAEAGCHLLLEKPIATSPAAASHLQSAASRAGVASVVFFTMRFDAAQSAFIDGLRDRGGWRSAWAIWLASIFVDGSPFANSPWRKERGALWDVGPHALSVLIPALGSVVSVSGERGDGDLVHLVFRHDSGATSTASLTLTAPPGVFRSDVGVWGEGGVERLPPPSGPPTAALARAAGELAASAMAGSGGGRGHPCDLRFGREVVDVLALAEAALDEVAS